MFILNKRKQESDVDETIYPLLPLRDVVVFPSMVVPLFVGGDKSIKALEYAMSHEKEVFLAAQEGCEDCSKGFIEFLGVRLMFGAQVWDYLFAGKSSELIKERSKWNHLLAKVLLLRS